MRPLRLRARNLRTYPDLDLEFGDGLIGILGELRDAPEGASSNGSGKSTILEAIDIALFGRRSLAGYLTRGGDVDELMVELTFQHGGETYRVRRTFSARGRGKTSVDLERFDVGEAFVPGDRDRDDDCVETAAWTPLTCASAKETDDLLCSLIGLSKETFRDSAYLRQGDGGYADPARDPSQRKKLLMEAVVGRDPVWPKLVDVAKGRRKIAEAQLERIQGESEGLRELAEQAQPAHVAARLAHGLVAEVTSALTSATERHDTATARYQQAREQGQARQTLTVELREAEAMVVTLQARAQQAETAAASLVTTRDEVAALATPEQLAALEGRHATAQTALTAAREAVAAAERAAVEHAAAVGRREQILARARAAAEKAAQLREQATHALEHVGAARCDRCEQTLGAEAAERAAANLIKEAQQLDHAAAALTVEADAIEIPAVPEPAEKDHFAAETNTLEFRHRELARELAAARQQLQQRARLDERIVQLERAATDRPTIDDIESAQARAAAKRQLLDDIEPVDLALLEQETKVARVALETARTARENAVAAAARADERLAQIKAAADKLADLATTAAGLQAGVDRDLLLERACGRDGIPALILENTAIPAIEAEASRILHALGTGFQVELRTQAENKTGGLRDTLDVVVIDQDGNECEYETGLSEGQKTRVGLALRIGLARLLRRRTGGSEMLALDEPSFLDAAGMVALLDVLREIEASGEFSLVFLVSHVAELRDSLEQTITVVQENGVSTIAGAAVREAVAA